MEERFNEMIDDITTAQKKLKIKENNKKLNYEEKICFIASILLIAIGISFMIIGYIEYLGLMKDHNCYVGKETNKEICERYRNN